MLAAQIFNEVKSGLPVAFRRNMGTMSVLFQKASDPIQQLFADKIREYRSKSDGGKKLVDLTPEIQRELQAELNRLSTQYGGDGGQDMTKFPDFKFPDAKIDPLN